MKRHLEVILLTIVILQSLTFGNPSSYTVYVPSENPNPTTTTFILESGKSYQIESSGYFICNDLHNLPADAEWWNNWGIWEEYYSLNPEEPSYYLDLLVNETGYDWLGTTNGIDWTPHTYSPSHTYRINITGNGELATFRIYDSNYQDNSNSLQVEISEISIIPAPGAFILGSIGIGAINWLRKRKTI
jgi:hypothetical protein